MPAGEQTDVEGKGIGIEWKVNVTTLITVLITIASAMWFVANTRSLAEQAQRDTRAIADMSTRESTRLETEIKASRASLEERLGDLRAAIASLPDQRARVDELVRYQQANELWKAATEARLQDTRDSLVSVRAILESIQRASGVPIPSSGRR